MSGAKAVLGIPLIWERQGRTVYATEVCGFTRKGNARHKNHFSALVQDAETPNDKLEAVAILMAAAPDLLAIVCAVEWAGETDMAEGGTEAACPICDGARRHGHFKKCRLSAALAKATPPHTEPSR